MSENVVEDRNVCRLEILTCNIRLLFEIYFRFGTETEIGCSIDLDSIVVGEIGDVSKSSCMDDDALSHFDIRKLNSQSRDWLWFVLNDNDLANELLKYWQDAVDFNGETFVLLFVENSKLSFRGIRTSLLWRRVSILIFDCSDRLEQFNFLKTKLTPVSVNSIKCFCNSRKLKKKNQTKERRTKARNSIEQTFCLLKINTESNRARKRLIIDEIIIISHTDRQNITDWMHFFSISYYLFVLHSQPNFKRPSNFNFCWIEINM